jgi:hypothetical protein
VALRPKRQDQRAPQVVVLRSRIGRDADLDLTEKIFLDKSGSSIVKAYKQ